MIRARSIVVIDPLVRANVFEALGGPGAPVGVTACRERGDTIVITFDDERTRPELVDALVEVALVFVPGELAKPGDFEEAAAVAACGLNDPAIDTSRIIETYLT